MKAIKIAFPYAGVGGPERACLEAGWPFDATSVIEKEKPLMLPLQILEDERFNRYGGTHKTLDTADMRTLKKAAYSGCENPQGMFGAAPCIDFTSIGAGAGIAGEHGQLFMMQLELAVKINELFGDLLGIFLVIPEGNP